MHEPTRHVPSPPPEPPRRSPAWAAAPGSLRPERAVWTLRLWGLRHPDLDAGLTLALVALLVWSRFAFLASGPWEWDETLFARGLLKFDLAAHFPHPPGFPLWILLGKLMLPFVSEPLRGLQLLSALASVASLWPLAALGRRLAPPPAATAAAVLVLFAPGVWLHAVRGFSSTPAAFFALWAAALAVWGLDGRRATAFSVLVAAAFLVRPILVPSLALLWLAGALAVRSWRRLLPGVAIGAGATAAAIAWMVAMQGSWAAFIRPFAVHGATHARNLAINTGAFADWGIVKGLGGVWTAAAVAVLAAAGMVVWWRRASRGGAAAWAGVLAVGIWQIVAIQNRTFPRYAVPFQLAMAPLAATAAGSLAPPAVGAAALLGLGAALGFRAHPLVEEQHTRLMPGWAAVRFAVERAQHEGMELVVEPGLHPFLSYLEEVDRRRGRTWPFRYHLAFSSPDARSVPAGPYLLVTDYPAQYFGVRVGPERTFAGVSADLVPFTQRRFLRCWVAANPLLPLEGWYLAEESRALGRLRWGGPGARLLLPPVPEGTSLAIVVAAARGDAPLPIAVDGTVVRELDGRAPRTPVRIDASLLSPARPAIVTFPRSHAYTPPRETRQLVVQLLGWEAPAGPSFPFSVSLADRQALAAIGARLSGAWSPERFQGVPGVWTRPSARVWLPAGKGTLRLLVSAPRPTPPSLQVLAGNDRLAGPIDPGAGPTWIEIPLPAHDPRTGGLDLELRAIPYSPARTGRGSDARELGVVLHKAEYHPAVKAVPGW
ncbi:MAG TPA: hypothetical protein P5234_10440 [Thermoanaerobaculaceae bacterium]|nr:hypothetical protein [Thermoanaerobaculaceae bacterium]HRS16646.1 hypothetical protein [Thermoanaerobaculaceae bacterium]